MTLDEETNKEMRLWVNPEQSHLVKIFENRGYTVKKITTGSKEPVAAYNGEYISGYCKILFKFDSLNKE